MQPAAWGVLESGHIHSLPVRGHFHHGRAEQLGQNWTPKSLMHLLSGSLRKRRAHPGPGRGSAGLDQGADVGNEGICSNHILGRRGRIHGHVLTTAQHQGVEPACRTARRACESWGLTTRVSNGGARLHLRVSPSGELSGGRAASSQTSLVWTCVTP